MSGSEETFWAVVIGSGFGGAVTACRLAEAFRPDKDPSKNICIIERGRRYGRHDFPRMMLPDYLTTDPQKLTSKRVPDVSRVSWANDEGLWELRNLGELRAGVAAGYGGGSLIYANVHLRAPDSVLGWKGHCTEDPCACRVACSQAGTEPPAYTREGLDPYYHRVAEKLDITPLPPRLRDRYPKTLAFKKIGDAMKGRARHMYPPLAIAFDEPRNPNNENKEGENRFGKEQHACTGCGNCVIGCQEGAKNTLDLNYLAQAETLGAVVRTLTEVRRIEPVLDGYRLHCEDHLLGSKTIWFTARHVFLCAGSLGSTELLLRSRIAVPWDAQGPLPLQPAEPAKPDDRNRFYGNGDNLAVVFDTDEALEPTHGPTITTALLHVGEKKTPRDGSYDPMPGESDEAAQDVTDEAAQQKTRPWFLLEDGGMPPNIVELLGLFRSGYWMGRNRFTPPGFVPRPPPAPAHDGPHFRAIDHLIENTALAFSQGLGGRVKPSPLPEQALASTAGLVQPAALSGLVDRLNQAESRGRQELRDVVADILRRVDAQLDAGVLTSLLRPLRSLLVDLDELVDMTAATLAERYPVLEGLLSGQGGAGIARFVVAALKLILFSTWSSSHSAVLLAMGPDRPGFLRLDRNDHLRARWDELKGLPLFSLQERFMRDVARELNGELRTNPDWTIGRVPLTDHLQGGLRMGPTSGAGFTRPCGEVWGYPRLFVMDAALFPNSVGVNPSSTIAAVAERNIELFIRRAKAPLPASAPDPGFGDLLAPKDTSKAFEEPLSLPVGITWDERLQGPLCKVDSEVHPPPFFENPRKTALHREPGPDFDTRGFEKAQRKGKRAPVWMEMNLRGRIDDLEEFVVQRHPGIALVSREDPQLPDVIIRRANVQEKETYKVQPNSFLRFEMDQPMEASTRMGARFWGEQRRMLSMTYHLLLEQVGATGTPRTCTVVGRKKLQDQPGLDVWSDLSTLYVVVKDAGGVVTDIGIQRVHLGDFIRYQLRGIDTTGSLNPENIPLDDAAKAWALTRFGRLFLGTVTNVYSQWL
jgi:choline dehydrogenase-like flavoprotein